MAKILITHGVPMDGFRWALRGHELIAPPAGERFSQAQLLQLTPDSDAIVACGAFNRELIQASERARLLVCYGAGYDSIDVAAATEYCLPVANVPDSVTETTAELALALILAGTRRICELDRALRAPGDTGALFTMGASMGALLTDMTLGIVGMGRIGARVAELGRGIGMRVAYAGHDIKPFSVAGNARHLPLEELVRTADVLSLHCPLTPQTNGLLTRELLFSMKSTAFLVNTARGRLIDEAALIDLLEQGRIAGAALDVYENEPEVSPRLKALPNVVLTPHIGSNTLRTRNRMAEQCADRIRDALVGRQPQNLLNPEVWPSRG